MNMMLLTVKKTWLFKTDLIQSIGNEVQRHSWVYLGGRETMKWKYVKVFLFWLALFNCSPILIRIPLLGGIIFFLPLLFWINIPGFLLAILIGQPHYDIQEFGVVPQTLLAWFLIATFWILLSVGLTIRRCLLSRPSVNHKQNCFSLSMVVFQSIQIYIQTLIIYKQCI